MSAPRCTCPHVYDERMGGSVRHALDHACPVHGSRHREPPHCPTCTCGIGSPIVQEPARPAHDPEAAARLDALREKADSPGERHD